MRLLFFIISLYVSFYAQAADPVRIVWVDVPNYCGYLRITTHTNSSWNIKYFYILSGQDNEGNRRTNTFEDNMIVRPNSAQQHTIVRGLIDCRKPFTVSSISYRGYDLSAAEAAVNAKEEKESKDNIRALIERDERIERGNQDYRQRIEDKKQAVRDAAIKSKKDNELALQLMRQREKERVEKEKLARKDREYKAYLKSGNILPGCEGLDEGDYKWCENEAIRQKKLSSPGALSESEALAAKQRADAIAHTEKYDQIRQAGAAARDAEEARRVLEQQRVEQKILIKQARQEKIRLEVQSAAKANLDSAIQDAASNVQVSRVKTESIKNSNDDLSNLIDQMK